MIRQAELSQPLRHRNGELVDAIVSTIADDSPIPWATLVNAYTATGDHAERTITNILYELSAFGAIERIGHPGARRRLDTRALRITTLGAQWLQQKGQPCMTATNPNPTTARCPPKSSTD